MNAFKDSSKAFIVFLILPLFLYNDNMVVLIPDEMYYGTKMDADTLLIYLGCAGILMSLTETCVHTE